MVQYEKIPCLRGCGSSGSSSHTHLLPTFPTALCSPLEYSGSRVVSSSTVDVDAETSPGHLPGVVLLYEQPQNNIYTKRAGSAWMRAAPRNCLSYSPTVTHQQGSHPRTSMRSLSPGDNVETPNIEKPIVLPELGLLSPSTAHKATPWKSRQQRGGEV